MLTASGRLVISLMVWIDLIRIPHHWVGEVIDGNDIISECEFLRREFFRRLNNLG